MWALPVCWPAEEPEGALWKHTAEAGRTLRSALQRPRHRCAELGRVGAARAPPLSSETWCTALPLSHQPGWSHEGNQTRFTNDREHFKSST